MSGCTGGSRTEQGFCFFFKDHTERSYNMIWCVTDSNEAEGLAGYSPTQNIVACLISASWSDFCVLPCRQQPFIHSSRHSNDVGTDWEREKSLIKPPTPPPLLLLLPVPSLPAKKKKIPMQRSVCQSVCARTRARASICG